MNSIAQRLLVSLSLSKAVNQARIYQREALPNHQASFLNVAINVNNLGMVLRALGDLQGAKKYLERALEISEKNLGQDHPNVAINVNNIGMVLQDLGDLQGAKEHYERALQVCRKRLGEDHPTTKTIEANLETLSR